MNDIERQRNHFEKIAEKYFLARNNANSQEMKKAIWEFFFIFFNDYMGQKDKSSLSILEAMCGTVDSYEFFTKMFPFQFSFEAFDYSKNMLAFAKKLHPSLHIFCEDICKIKFENLYDIVLVIGGLHHVYSNIDLAISNISKSMSPDGIFISFEPTNNNIITRFIRNVTYKTNNLFDNKTERAFTTTSLDALAQKHGLKKIFQFYPGLISYILWYNPDAFPFLNIGSVKMVQNVISIEKKFWTTPFARYCSFATFTCYRKGIGSSTL